MTEGLSGVDRLEQSRPDSPCLDLVRICQTQSNAFNAFPLLQLVPAHAWRNGRRNQAFGKQAHMFLILAVVLVILWIGGFTVMHVSSLFIHLLLLFAIISVIMHFVVSRRAA
jgi:uncharacterized MAPEG superfamily protein